jgi:hypothetical protein
MNWLKSIYSLKEERIESALLIQNGRKRTSEYRIFKNSLILEQNWKRKEDFAVVKKKQKQNCSFNRKQKKKLKSWQKR